MKTMKNRAKKRPGRPPAKVRRENLTIRLKPEDREYLKTIDRSCGRAVEILIGDRNMTSRAILGLLDRTSRKDMFEGLSTDDLRRLEGLLHHWQQMALVEINKKAPPRSGAK